MVSQRRGEDPAGQEAAGWEVAVGLGVSTGVGLEGRVAPGGGGGEGEAEAIRRECLRT